MVEPTKDTLLGFISEQHVYLQFMVSMLNAVLHPRVTRVAFVEGGPQIHQHRNALNHAFMDGPEEYLLTVDTDVAFAPEMLDELHTTLAQYPDAGGVSGLLMSSISYGIGNGYMLLGGEWDGEPGAAPTWSSLKAVPEDVLPDACAGAGFMLLRKSALKDLGDYPFDPIPFEKEGDFRMTSPTRVMAEDVAFLYRMRQAGHPLVLDPKVRPIHLKTIALRVNEGLKDAGPLEDTTQKLWTPGSDNLAPNVVPMNRAARRRLKQ